MLNTDLMNHRRSGFALLEALIALLVLAVGLLALGQFQGRLMQTSGESKMVSEAVHYAQQKIDQLRTLAWDHDDLAIDNHEDDPIEGTNAVFRVVWNVTEQAVGIKNVVVRVVLPNDVGRQVTAMQTWIAEGSDVVLAFEQSGGDIVELEDLDGYTPPDPTGVDGISVGDYEDPDGNDYIVIADEESGFALLVPGSTNGSGDASGSGFARISGNIFVDDPDGFAVEDVEKYRISITGAGVCRVFPTAGEFSSPPQLFLDQTTIDGSEYRMLGYSCFVPNDWQGFIRLRAPEGICIGSFGKVEGGILTDGPLPQGALPGASGALIDRYYFGLDADGLPGGAGVPGSPVPGQAEIGSVCLVASGCETETTRNLVPGGHHFLVTSLDPESTDSVTDQCRTAMLEFDATAYVHPDKYRSNPFWDNPSSLVCVAGACKGVTGTASRFRPRFGGFFANPLAVGMEHETLAMQFCQSFGPFEDKGGTYWCAVNHGAIGQIVPTSLEAAFDADPSNNSTLTSDADANNERYYFSTQDKPNLAGVQATTLNIAKTLHFTNMNFRMLSGSTIADPLTPEEPIVPTDPSNPSCINEVEGIIANNVDWVTIEWGEVKNACTIISTPGSTNTFACEIDTVNSGQTMILRRHRTTNTKSATANCDYQNVGSY